MALHRTSSRSLTSNPFAAHFAAADPSDAEPASPPRDLVPALRASLTAKLERLLDRPLVARISGAVVTPPRPSFERASSVLQAIASIPSAGHASGAATSGWSEDPSDGTWRVAIELDYDDLWRGREKEVRERVSSTVESSVTFLTDEQRLLLERSPRELLELMPRPETAELVDFEVALVGGSERLVSLRVASAPDSRSMLRHVAIIPNLVQIERQLEALRVIEDSPDDGPLAPLRTLVGLCGPDVLATASSDAAAPDLSAPADGRLDEFQAACITKALATPHFAVIEGPPGSGKTTVIASIVRRSLEKGGRVLVVSPTHVAVDNVVEKLASGGDAENDALHPHTLPVRFAARDRKLSVKAREYWVGSKKQARGAAVARRVERRLVATVPFAQELFDLEDADAEGTAPLSAAVARVEGVVCGTPIGILSYESLKQAAPGSFDLLIVDEVSKLTLPEFLAIAVKARRWVVVGDPAQLPPHNDVEDNAVTLDDVIDPTLELACSVSLLVSRARSPHLEADPVIVVASEPGRALAVVRAQVGAVLAGGAPTIGTLSDARPPRVLVCRPEDLARAAALLSPMLNRDRTHAQHRAGSIRLLVERGIDVVRPDFASGVRLVEPRDRAQAKAFDHAFNAYHAEPSRRRTAKKLHLLSPTGAQETHLPSPAAVDALRAAGDAPDIGALDFAVAERFAVNAVSVYDWLTGLPADFAAALLRDLTKFNRAALCDAVKPYVGTLKRQYRMHPSLSRVPRDLFYFGEALQDGRPSGDDGCRVGFRRVVGGTTDGGESNPREVADLCDVFEKLNSTEIAVDIQPNIMVLTPYRKQEALLRSAFDDLARRGATSNLVIEVLTLDRCQGREANYVFISLVRNRPTAFMDMPKRWNVALTRATEGLYFVGDVEAYLREAVAARGRIGQPGERAGRDRAKVPWLARIIEAYDMQIRAAREVSQ